MFSQYLFQVASYILIKFSKFVHASMLDSVITGVLAFIQVCNTVHSSSLFIFDITTYHPCIRIRTGGLNIIKRYLRRNHRVTFCIAAGAAIQLATIRIYTDRTVQTQRPSWLSSGRMLFKGYYVMSNLERCTTSYYVCCLLSSSWL